jgi:hypothetical protein
MSIGNHAFDDIPDCSAPLFEDVDFTFQSIMVEEVADKTTATDTWHEIAPQPLPVPPDPIRLVVPA